jgi:hypothetical protein
MSERIITTDADFAAALKAVLPGDRLYLRGGIYKQAPQVLRGGEPGRLVRIMPWADERPIFVLPSQQGTPGQWFVNAPFVSVEGVTLKGGDCIRSETLAEGCEFRNCTVRNSVGNGISIRGPRTTVEGCDLQIAGTDTNKAHSLYIAASGCVVRRNYLGTAGNGSALHLYPATISDCLIEHNEIEQWGGVTGTVMVCGKRHLFRHNTIRGYGVAALAFLGADGITFEDSDMRGELLVYDQYSTVENPLNATMRRCKLRGKMQTAAGWKLSEQDNNWEK